MVAEHQVLSILTLTFYTLCPHSTTHTRAHTNSVSMLVHKIYKLILNNIYIDI